MLHTIWGREHSLFVFVSMTDRLCGLGLGLSYQPWKRFRLFCCLACESSTGSCADGRAEVQLQELLSCRQCLPHQMTSGIKCGADSRRRGQCAPTLHKLAHRNRAQVAWTMWFLFPGLVLPRKTTHPSSAWFGRPGRTFVPSPFFHQLPNAVLCRPAEV